jgi:hypothetical protein
MRRILLLVAASACFAAPTTDAAGGKLSTAPSTQASVVQSEAAVLAARSERQQRVELNRRMEAVLEASKKTLAGLQAMIDASTNPATTEDLERRMAEVKKGTTIDLLRVQATFAREHGRIAQADAIDAEIDAILNPKRPAGGAR